MIIAVNLVLTREKLIKYLSNLYNNPQQWEARRDTLRKGGTLRAKIYHTDGTSETLYKEITVQ